MDNLIIFAFFFLIGCVVFLYLKMVALEEHIEHSFREELKEYIREEYLDFAIREYFRVGSGQTMDKMLTETYKKMQGIERVFPFQKLQCVDVYSPFAKEKKEFLYSPKLEALIDYLNIKYEEEKTTSKWVKKK